MSYRKLGRNSAARKALFTSILTSFFRYGRIETTEAKAKELRKFAENLITLAKRGDLSARRQAIAELADEDVVRKLFDEIAGKYADRQGGYTRILKLGVRRGDAAPMVIIELVSSLVGFTDIQRLSATSRQSFFVRRYPSTLFVVCVDHQSAV